MFSIFRKATSFNLAPFLEADMHAHFLPGIDDGAADVRTSLQLIEGMVGLGYRKLIATPHIMGDLYPNTRASITAAYEEVAAALTQHPYPVSIEFAAEYLIDEQFSPKIEEGLLCFGNRLVLVETMFAIPPPSLEHILFQMETHQYRPVLAHPERYHYVDKNLHQLEPFKKRDCLFQINILSLAGYYGDREKELAVKLLEADMVDFAGTDLHHTRHLQALRNFRVPARIAAKLEQIRYQNPALAK